MYITALDATPQEIGADDGLEVVGGKGKSLAKLAEAGFNVPGGFVVTAAAYRSFVATNQLQQKIVSLAKPAVEDGRVSFESASDAIQALFAEYDLSAEIIAEIRQAYGPLDDAPAAVRSSANAEDLPGLSFAGQQETYLNVSGADEVVRGGAQLLGFPMDAASHQLSASERHRPGLGGHGGGRPGHGAL